MNGGTEFFVPLAETRHSLEEWQEASTCPPPDIGAAKLTDLPGHPPTTHLQRDDQLPINIVNDECHLGMI